MKRSNMVPISPPHLINTIVIAVILLVSLIAIIVFHFILYFANNLDDYYWIFYLCWGIYFVILGGAAFVSYRGIAVVKIYDSYAESLLFKKRCCRLDFEKVEHVSFMRSVNYGRDLDAGYIVLSKESINGKNIALSYSLKKQIVIRVSYKNYVWVKYLLKPLQIDAYLPSAFDSFQKIIFDRKIYLQKHPEKNWSYHVELVR